MAKKGKTKINKRLMWFRYFTDETNPATFLNQTASAKAAKYKCKTEESFANVGLENFRKLEVEISNWLEDIGLSENKLKTKLLSLIEAKKTIFQKTKGQVNTTTLPNNVFILSESNKMAWGGKGEDAQPYDDGETVLAINVEDPEIQRKTLDMALKVKGLYAPEQKNVKHSGTVGLKQLLDDIDGETAGPPCRND